MMVYTDVGQGTHMVGDPSPITLTQPQPQHPQPQLVFDLCFVDSLRRRRNAIEDLETDFETLRERAPPGLPDGYDGYNTLNAFFVAALLGILIPMALQRCVVVLVPSLSQVRIRAKS